MLHESLIWRHQVVKSRTILCGVSHLHSALSPTFLLPSPQALLFSVEGRVDPALQVSASCLSPVKEPSKSYFFKNITNDNQIGSWVWWKVIQKACSQILVWWKQIQVMEREVAFFANLHLSVALCQFEEVTWSLQILLFPGKLSVFIVTVFVRIQWVNDYGRDFVNRDLFCSQLSF